MTEVPATDPSTTAAGVGEPDTGPGGPADHTGEHPLMAHARENDEWMARLASARGLALRPSKVQIAALVLLSVFALGPLVAMVVILRSEGDPSTSILVSEIPAPTDGAQVVGTITRVDPVAGELALRLLVLPQSDLLDNGRLIAPLDLRLNDGRGNSTVTFPAGEVPAPIETTLALSGGSVSRYPFDSYQAPLTLVLLPDMPTADDQVQAIPVALDLVTTVTDFDLVAGFAVDDPATAVVEPISSPTFTLVDLRITRSEATTVYAMGIMALMWGLAATGVLMAWAVVIWRVDTPMWVYTYFVGVLFALPPLREALPGRPPPGTLVDYAAFYWSIGIIGVTLLLMTGLWIRRSRPEDRPRLFSRRHRADDHQSGEASPRSPDGPSSEVSA